MLVNSASITEKSYKQLTLLARADGFSFAVKELLSGNVERIDAIRFGADAHSVSGQYEAAFANASWAAERFDQVILLYQNPYNTLVPEPLFDERYLGNYLQYGTKVFETDTFAYDNLAAYGMQQVYLPFDDISAVVKATFTRVQPLHAASVLVPRLLDRTKNIDEKIMFVHFCHGHFDLVVAQNQKLLLYNTFEYRTVEDFLYYVLFCAEQLSMNPESFRMEMLGAVRQDGPEFELAYRYIRNVSFLMPDETVEDAQRWREHYILMQA